MAVYVTPNGTVLDDGFTMRASTYEIFKRVPAEWWNEVDAKADIAEAVEQTLPSVAHRVSWLIRVGLVERRTKATPYGSTEIRKAVGRSTVPGVHRES